MFWKSEPVTITGWKKARIETLLQHQINMAGYHLPLDVHPQLGNNAQLAEKLDWVLEKQFGEQKSVEYRPSENHANIGAVV